MEHDIDAALADARGPTWALIGMSFFAVAREGLESVFFLLAHLPAEPGAGGAASARCSASPSPSCSATASTAAGSGSTCAASSAGPGSSSSSSPPGLAAERAAQPARGGHLEPPAAAGLGPDPHAAGQLGPRHASSAASSATTTRRSSARSWSGRSCSASRSVFFLRPAARRRSRRGRGPEPWPTTPRPLPRAHHQRSRSPAPALLVARRARRLLVRRPQQPSRAPSRARSPSP